MPRLITNIRIYLAIAEEAAAESKRLSDSARTPMPNGQPGYAVAYDPDQRSFKQSLIAVAFAGMYLEALFTLVGRQRFGAGYSALERRQWEVKLKALGVDDEELQARCRQFREARNDLVHEKPFDLDEPASGKLRSAQEEAAIALEVVKAIAARLHRP
jgi:hypothetical protein